MTRPLSVSLLFAGVLAFTTVAYAVDSPYAGQEKRAIKASSEQEISDYLNGRGMGTSKAAELNHYPGPKHVLDEATKLNLSAEQSAKTTAIYQTMNNKASRLGKTIVQKENELEALYANQQATVENISQLVNEIARLQAEFRLVHLNAHLEMRNVLTPKQVALYDQSRGYDQTGSSGEHKHHH